MSLESIFPRYLGNSTQANHPIWKEELGDVAMFVLDEVIGDDIVQKVNSIGIDELHGQLMILIQEIHQQKDNATPKELERLDFMQFSFSTEGASLSCNHGRFTAAHDFLVWGLVDKIEYGETEIFDTGKVARFITSQEPFINQNAVPQAFEWLRTLFYYSRHHGGLKGVCLDALDMFGDIFFPLFNSVPASILPQELFVGTCCQVLSWRIDNKDARAVEIAQYLESIYDSLEDSNKKTVCIQLGTGGSEYTSLTSGQWAFRGLYEFKSHLKAHEELHLKSVYYITNHTEIQRNLADIIQAIDAYNNHLGPLDPISKKYEKTRIFGVVRGLIAKCIGNGWIETAAILICCYYSIEDSERKIKNQLMVLVNHKANILYGVEGKVKVFEEKPHQVLIDLFIQANVFLGATLVLHDVPDFPLQQPRVPGIPVKQEGANFEAQLVNHYQFERLRPEDVQDVDSMIIFPGLQHPVQALMYKYLKNTFPINVSLRQPKKVRVIRKALVWCYGTTSSDLETILVKKILSDAGIEVETPDLLSSNKADFLDKYESMEFDLVWLGTHGEYDHMNPHKSTIPILPNAIIELSELMRSAPKIDEQRVLVMNICDGATAATYNALYDLGFGASVCGPTQGVISHIWPVELWPALIFGLVLAHYIGEGNQGWDAYVKTIDSLLKDNQSIHELLDAHNLGEDYESLWDRIHGDLNENIYYWGSPVYYN